MESQPLNPEFRITPENFYPCVYAFDLALSLFLLFGIHSSEK